jgi:hypothetical protein
MSVFRFSSVIQSLRAVFASAADSSPVRDDGHQMRGEPAVHAGAEPGLRIGEAPASVQEEFLVMGKPVLVTCQDALQRQVR